MIENLERITEEARAIFKHCGAEDDFLVQTVNDDSVVFGDWNRLVYRPDEGWYLVEYNCTSEFIARFDSWIKVNRQIDF